jgi:hypothetical protein
VKATTAVTVANVDAAAPGISPSAKSAPVTKPDLPAPGILSQ